MPRESEIKARVASPAALRSRIEAAGGRVTAERAFEDNLLLDASDGRIRQAGFNLRVRLTGGRALLTWKGQKTLHQGVRSREEIEVWCDQGDTLLELLDRLGFKPRFRYQKYREEWSLDGTRVMLDATPIGDFIEVEGEPEGVLRVAARLGFAAEDLLAETYPALFARALAERGLPPGEMVFERATRD